MNTGIDEDKNITHIRREQICRWARPYQSTVRSNTEHVDIKPDNNSSVFS